MKSKTCLLQIFHVNSCYLVILFLHVIEILMVKMIYFDNIRLLFSCNCSYYPTIFFFVKGYIYIVQHCLLLLQLHENLYKNLDYLFCKYRSGVSFIKLCVGSLLKVYVRQKAKFCVRQKIYRFIKPCVHTPYAIFSL
jgi:hypothetical protein